MFPPGLRRLVLTRFRNHASLDLEVEGRPVVIAGPNGAGKTNILEAISCLSPGRGLRRAPTPDLARRPDPSATLVEGPWGVAAEVETASGPVRLGAGQDPGSPARRLHRRDGAAATASSFADTVRLSWLTPAHDRVFTASRSERLRFFDRLVLAFAPDHALHAARYELALRERSRLLAERGDRAWIDGLERELADAGAAIVSARAGALERLIAEIEARPETAFPKADLELANAIGAGACEVGAAPVGALADRLRHGFAGSRARDSAAGRALFGPHRADLRARHRGHGSPAAQCSTGEQKALLVGLALAHARAVAGSTDAAVLLLLDEAVAHLDAARREALAGELASLPGQAWATGTDEALFAGFADRTQIVRLA